jgi:four helix bundle protein
MSTKQEELRDRTKAFALRIITLYRALPPRPDAQILGKQVLRSGTAVGANYRATSRARSRAEFAAKIGIVVEEADETVFWLELLLESGIIGEDRLGLLLEEARELTAIFTAAQRTVRSRL